MNSISSSTHTAAASGPTPCAKPEPQGFAARIAQLGPTLGTAVAATELAGDAAAALYDGATASAQATYTLAHNGLHRLAHTAGAVADATGHLVDQASRWVHGLESDASAAAQTVSGAVTGAVSDAVSGAVSGAVSDTAHAVANGVQRGTEALAHAWHGARAARAQGYDPVLPAVGETVDKLA